MSLNEGLEKKIAIIAFLFKAHSFSGCSAARLAHHVRDVGAGSSNLLTPTTQEPRQ